MNIDINKELTELFELLVLNETSRIGRYTLKNILKITEGKVRSRLKNLQSRGIIEANATGAKLTKKGLVLLSQKLDKYQMKKIIFNNQEILGLKNYHYLFHIEIKNDQKINWLDLRDEVIRGGALSAIFIKKVKNKMIVPNVIDDLEKQHIELSAFIKDNFELKNEDVIIVSSAENKWEGLLGGLRAIIKFNFQLKHKKLSTVT